MSKTSTDTSIFLSYVLRHRPEEIGITLDAAGWTPVAALLTALAQSGNGLTRAELERIVAENDKKRFAFSSDGKFIRASQGHSVSVDLGLEPARPPKMLYHGTVERFLDGIRRDGLKPGRRHHVHLHDDIAVATAVGRRRGEPVILAIDAEAMVQDGHRFYVSANGVWLTDHVPSHRLSLHGAQRSAGKKTG